MESRLDEPVRGAQSPLLSSVCSFYMQQFALWLFDTVYKFETYSRCKSGITKVLEILF